MRWIRPFIRVPYTMKESKMSTEHDESAVVLDMTDMAYAKTVISDFVLLILIRRLDVSDEVSKELNRLRQIAASILSDSNPQEGGEKTLSVKHLNKEIDRFLDRLAS